MLSLIIRTKSSFVQDGWLEISLNIHALVIVHPDVKNWIKYARFEEKHGYIAHARKVYERAVEFFGEDHMDENLYVAFAKFEENQKEVSSSIPYV